MLIIGKVSDESLLEINGTIPVPPIADIATNHGLTPAEISTFTPSNADTARINQGDTFVLTWAAGVITGVDFSTEDAKFQVEVIASKNDFAADGVDTVSLTVSAFKADGITPQNVAGTKELPFLLPDGRVVKLPLPFAGANQVVIPFVTTKAGWYQFPVNNTRFNLDSGTEVKVKAMAKIDGHYIVGTSI